VRQLLFASATAEGLVLTDPAGRRLTMEEAGLASDRSGARRGGALVVASRLDYEVRTFPVPPVPAREERDLITFRLRALHPGNPEDTCFDYSITRMADASKLAVVYLMDRTIFDLYRPLAECGALLSFDSLVTRAVRPGNAVVCVRRPEYTEWMRFGGGALLESRLNDVADAAGSPECSVTIEEGGGAGGDAAAKVVIPLTDLQPPRLRRGVAPLFLPERSGAIPLRCLAAALLSIAAIALSVALAFRIVGTYQARLDSVKAHYQAVMTRYAGEATDAKVYLAAREELDALVRRRPVDLYAFLACLAKYVRVQSDSGRSSSLFIDAISFSNGTFSVDGFGGEPFATAEALSGQPGFHTVRVTQIVPEDRGSRVHFTLTGKYDGR